MTELLNLDELSGESREVTLKGKNYPIAEQSVGQMIELSRLERRIKEIKDPEVIFEQMISTAQEIVPTCPSEVLRTLSVKQLTVLMNFANASTAEVVEAAKAHSAEESLSEKK